MRSPCPAAARDLGVALMRRYVVQAASTTETGGNRSRDKVTEFFDKMAPEIHNRPEWRDWFGTCCVSDRSRTHRDSENRHEVFSEADW